MKKKKESGYDVEFELPNVSYDISPEQPHRSKLNRIAFGESGNRFNPYIKENQPQRNVYKTSFPQMGMATGFETSMFGVLDLPPVRRRFRKKTE